MAFFNWINKITVYLVTRWKEIWCTVVQNKEDMGIFSGNKPEYKLFLIFELLNQTVGCHFWNKIIFSHVTPLSRWLPWIEFSALGAASQDGWTLAKRTHQTNIGRASIILLTDVPIISSILRTKGLHCLPCLFYWKNTYGNCVILSMRQIPFIY